MHMTANKITLFFLGLAGSFVVFALLLFNQGSALKKLGEDISVHWIPNIIAINAIHTATSDYRSTVAQHVISEQDTEMEEHEQILTRLSTEIAGWQNWYKQNISQNQERVLYDTYIGSYQDYDTATRQVLALSQTNEARAFVQFRRNRGLFNTLNSNLVDLVQFNIHGNHLTAQRNATGIEQIKTLIATGSVVLTGIGFGVFLLLHIRLRHAFTDSQQARRITRRMSLLFTMMLGGLAAFTGLFYQQFSYTSQQINELNQQRVPSVLAINALNTGLSDYRVTEALYVLSITDDENTLLDQHLKTLAVSLADLRSQCESILHSAQEKTLYQEFISGYEEYITSSDQTLARSRSKDSKQARAQLRLSGILFADFRSALDNLIKTNQRAAIEQSHDINASLDTLKIIILGGSGLILLLLTLAAQMLKGWLLNTGEPATHTNSKTLLTIKLKLRLAFLGMVATFGLFSLMVNGVMGSMNQQTNRLENDFVPSIIEINAMSSMTSEYRLAEAQHLLAKTEADTLLWDKKLKRLSDRVKNTRTRYESLISSDDEQALYKIFSAGYDEYLARSERMLQLSRKNSDVPASSQFLHNRILFESFSADLRKLVDSNSLRGLTLAHQNNNVFSRTQQLILAVVMTILMLAILAMVVFDRNISLALQKLTGLMRRLAVGDMIDVRDDLATRADEIGEMAKAVSVVSLTLQKLSGDALELIDATQAGVLSIRADSTRHPGEYGKIVAGMNALIDGLSNPLTDVAQIMQNLALGELDGRMQGEYQGELKILKTNVNRSLDALVHLLNELGQVMRHLSDADLTQVLEGQYHGEFSVLKANTNKTIGRLVQLLREISDGMAQSAVAITQTSESSRYVAAQSSQQMLAIEQVSRTLEETAVSVHDIADKAQQGSALATTTAHSTREGQTQLTRLIELIQHIDAEYGRIERITDEITRIADKTHLLSLNAGLEAMRAGEQGAGFGFVARQIGQLAEEVSLSARNIGDVISHSGQKIRMSVHATQETQAAMAQIAEAARISQDNANAISVAIVQQSAAVSSLTERVTDIRLGSEATASASEQISATMSHLAHTIQNTATQSAQFKL
ncbi:MAG: hypothetical protein RLZZ226_1194 [Pseudomonadota bacterium]